GDPAHVRIARRIARRSDRRFDRRATGRAGQVDPPEQLRQLHRPPPGAAIAGPVAAGTVGTGGAAAAGTGSVSRRFKRMKPASPPAGVFGVAIATGGEEAGCGSGGGASRAAVRSGSGPLSGGAGGAASGHWGESRSGRTPR